MDTPKSPKGRTSKKGERHRKSEKTAPRGVGMPKGYVTKKTLDKVAAREALRRIVMRDMDKLVRAQIQNALGIAHLFLRDDAGRFVQVTDVEAIERALNSGEAGSAYYIHTKDPSIQAFTDLMNRALDKPKEQEAEVLLRVEDVRGLSTADLAAEAHALAARLGQGVAREALTPVVPVEAPETEDA